MRLSTQHAQADRVGGEISSHTPGAGAQPSRETLRRRLGLLGVRSPIALFILLSLAISAPIGVLTVYVADSSTDLAIRDTIATDAAAVRLASRTVTERLTTAQSALDSVARTPHALDADAGQVFQTLPGVHALLRIDDTGKIKGSWDANGLAPLASLSLSAASVEANTLTSRTTPSDEEADAVTAIQIREAFRDAQGNLLIPVISRPEVTTGDQPASRLAALVRASSLLPLLEGGRLKEGGYVYLVDERGVLIAHPSSLHAAAPIDLERSPILRRALTGVPSSGRTRDPVDGTEVLMAVAPIAGTTWMAVARQSVDVALKGARDQAAGATAIALVLLLLAIFFSALVAVLWARSHRLNDELAASLTRERGIASALQENLLSKLPELDALDLGVKHASATEGALVGGDFYDVVPLDDNRTAIVIGDVCGKGVGTAVQTAVTRGLIRGLLPTTRSPSELLSKVNQRLGSLSGTFSNPETFVTIVIGVYDRRNGEFRYSQAGHPCPLLASSNRTVALPLLEGVPLGILPDSEYKESAVRLKDGDSLLFFTDGLIETRGPEGMIGEDRVLKVFARYAQLHPKDVAKSIFDMAVEYSGGNLTDDVAIMCVRRPPLMSGSFPRPTPSSRLDSAMS